MKKIFLIILIILSIIFILIGAISWKKQNGYHKIVFEDGSRYEGNWVNDKKHGKGKYTWKNNHIAGKIIDGDRYEGDWQNDMMHGKGKYLEIDDNDEAILGYEGEWKNDDKHGYGLEIKYDYGILYEGEYQNHKKHGIGRLLNDIFSKRIYSPGKDNYIGLFFEDRKDKYGIYTTDDNNKYIELWKNGNLIEDEYIDETGIRHYKKITENKCDEMSDLKKKNVNCKETDNVLHTYKYKVMFDNDVVEELYGSNVRAFSYLITNKKFVYKTKSGINYRWFGKLNKENKPEGIGKAVYEDGNYFHGNLKNGLRSGKGIFKWGYECMFDGEWKDDKGYSGKLIFTNVIKIDNKNYKLEKKNVVEIKKDFEPHEQEFLDKIKSLKA